MVDEEFWESSFAEKILSDESELRVERCGFFKMKLGRDGEATVGKLKCASTAFRLFPRLLPQALCAFCDKPNAIFFKRAVGYITEI